MTDYLNEDSYCSWHTCQEGNQLTKPSTEEILKDFNMGTHDSDEDSIEEFQQIIDKTDAFNNFKKGNNSNDGFLRPSTSNKPLAQNNFLKRENSTLLSGMLRSKYLNNNEQLQQNVSLADKTTPSNNVYIKVTETSHEVPYNTINDEKFESIKSNLLSVNQTSSMTLIEAQSQDNEQPILIPGSSLSTFKEKIPILPPSDKPNNMKVNIKDTKSNLEDKKENLKDNIKESIEVTDLDDKKENLKDNIKESVEITENNASSSIKNNNDNMEVVKGKINDDIEDAKESDEEINENNNIVNDTDENPGKLVKLFSYFKGFGKSENNENNENDDDQKDKIEKENVNNAIKNIIDAQNLKPPALITESSSLTMVDYEESDDSEFVNAYDDNYNENSYENNNKNAYENYYDKNSYYSNSNEISYETTKSENEDKYEKEDSNKDKDKDKDEDEDEDEDEYEYEYDDDSEFVNAYQEAHTIINNHQQNIDVTQDVVIEDTIVQNPNGKENMINKNTTYVKEDNINNINENKPLPTIADNNILNNNQNNNNIIDNNNINSNNDNKIINNDNNSINENETVENDESEASTDDFQDAITTSFININTNNEPQFSSQNISKIHPVGISDKEETTKIINSKLMKKGSLNTLKPLPLNIELVPVHKPINEVGDNNNCTFDSFKTGIQDSKILNEEQVNDNILPNKNSNKILKKKHKKRKWYKKIFRLAICKKRDDI